MPDDRFEVQNDPTCTNVGFSLISLSREAGIWRKGTVRFSCSHLAVDISRCWASYCAEQPQVSMGVPRYRARKKGRCIGSALERRRIRAVFSLVGRSLVTDFLLMSDSMVFLVIMDQHIGSRYSTNNLPPWAIRLKEEILRTSKLGESQTQAQVSDKLSDLEGSSWDSIRSSWDSIRSSWDSRRSSWVSRSVRQFVLCHMH